MVLDAEYWEELLALIVCVEISLVPIVIVSTSLAFTFTLGIDDVKREITVFEASKLSVLNIGVDWLIAVDLLVSIVAECPSDKVAFLLISSWLDVKVLGTIRDARELTSLEVVASITVPNEEFCTITVCEGELEFSDNDLDGTVSAVEATFDNIEERAEATGAEAVLFDIDEAGKRREVTLSVVLIEIALVVNKV